MNEVSCSPPSGSQVDDLPGVTGSKGICSSVGSSGLDSCSPNGVDELNDTETEMIGMKPKDAIKLKEVPLVA